MNTDKDIKQLRRQLWIAIVIIILIIITFSIAFFYSFNEFKRKLAKNKVVHTDTVRIVKEVFKPITNPYLQNKEIEDSLQHRIDRVLDSLSILEKKLKVVQENSSSSIELITGIADSIEYYRKETVKLKQRIETINKETAQLLKKEKDNNEGLRNKIESYEKRLMSLYVINLEATIYSDGFDQNNKLVTTTQAAKAKEIAITCQLSRDLIDDEKVSIEVSKSVRKIYTFNNAKETHRIIKRRFKIQPNVPLTAGYYEITIYHDNVRSEIKHTVIGKTSFTLE